MSFLVRPIRAADWREFREIRLRMLADTPIAYNETLAAASALLDEEWMHRTARNEEDGRVGFAAISDDGRWLGVMRGYRDAKLGPMLVGVFVDPSTRGTHAGVADALLDSVIGWAQKYGPILSLYVHEDNSRAIAFYERRGFRATGATLPYNLPPFGRENEMRMRIDR